MYIIRISASLGNHGAASDGSAKPLAAAPCPRALYQEYATPFVMRKATRPTSNNHDAVNHQHEQTHLQCLRERTQAHACLASLDILEVLPTVHAPRNDWLSDPSGIVAVYARHPDIKERFGPIVRRFALSTST
jgi:hypothetical protein